MNVKTYIIFALALLTSFVAPLQAMQQPDASTLSNKAIHWDKDLTQTIRCEKQGTDYVLELYDVVNNRILCTKNTAYQRCPQYALHATGDEFAYATYNTDGTATQLYIIDKDGAVRASHELNGRYSPCYIDRNTLYLQDILSKEKKVFEYIEPTKGGPLEPIQELEFSDIWGHLVRNKFEKDPIDVKGILAKYQKPIKENPIKDKPNKQPENKPNQQPNNNKPINNHQNDSAFKLTHILGIGALSVGIVGLVGLVGYLIYTKIKASNKKIKLKKPQLDN